MHDKGRYQALIRMDDEKGKVSRDLVPVKRDQALVQRPERGLPAIVERSSSQAAFAWEEFFAGEVSMAIRCFNQPIHSAQTAGQLRLDHLQRLDAHGET